MRETNIAFPIVPVVASQKLNGPTGRELTAQWIGLICFALSVLGQVGLSYPWIASRQGIVVSDQIEVPFRTLISLAEVATTLINLAVLALPMSRLNAGAAARSLGGQGRYTFSIRVRIALDMIWLLDIVADWGCCLVGQRT